MSNTFTPKFDQVVKGNVDIKQLCNKNKYKITFSEINEFLRYQIWSDSSKKLNENRIVYYQKAKKWIREFKHLNTVLKTLKKPLFKPTTVMKIGLKKYLFVLDKVKLNSKGHIVFKVSTKEIKLSEKKLLKLPCGHHDGVRFDIDPYDSNTVTPVTSCSYTSYPYNPNCVCTYWNNSLTSSSTYELTNVPDNFTWAQVGDNNVGYWKYTATTSITINGLQIGVPVTYNNQSDVYVVFQIISENQDGNYNCNVYTGKTYSDFPTEFQTALGSNANIVFSQSSCINCNYCNTWTTESQSGTSLKDSINNLNYSEDDWIWGKSIQIKSENTAPKNSWYFVVALLPCPDYIASCNGYSPADCGCDGYSGADYTTFILLPATITGTTEIAYVLYYEALNNNNTKSCNIYLIKNKEDIPSDILSHYSQAQINNIFPFPITSNPYYNFNTS